MPPSERFVIGSQRSEVAGFADRFEAWCEAKGIPMKAMLAFQVAFDEVLTNIIDYALVGVDAPSIEVRLQRDDDALHAEVLDNGPPFDPLSESDAPDLDLDLDDRPIGGLGIHLVRNLMDEVAYRRSDTHNHFSMSKRFASDDAD